MHIEIILQLCYPN